MTPFDIAFSFLGTTEVPGPQHNPLIVGLVGMAVPWVKDDETAWCGGFCGGICKIAHQPMPDNPLGARQWLTVGTPVKFEDAFPGHDIVILKRGTGSQPGPDVLHASGHVGFFVGPFGYDRVLVLGGNQSNKVSIGQFPVEDILGIRRLC